MYSYIGRFYNWRYADSNTLRKEYNSSEPKYQADVDPVTKNSKMINVIAEQLKKNIKDTIAPTLNNDLIKSIYTKIIDDRCNF